MTSLPAPGSFNAADRKHLRNPPWWHRLAYINRILPTAIRDAVDDAHIAQDAVVLDYGCADQQYRHLFARQRYLGADLPGNPQADVVIRDDGRLPLGDDSVDVVLSSQVLEHVANPALYLEESLRVLRPGGRLVLSTHGIMIFHPDPVDYWRWTGQGLQKILRDVGFEVVTQRGIMGLAATGLQLVQDSLYVALPRMLRPVVALGFQLLMALADRLQSDESRSYNALVFLVIARKPQPVNAETV